MNKKKIIITSNSGWNIYNFRFNLLNALSDLGFILILCIPKDSYNKILRNHFRIITLPMQITKINLFSELRLLFKYINIYRKEKPDVVMSYTIKPNIYSSIATRILHIPFLVNITGLGYTFINKNFITFISNILYRIALKKAQKVFFHNNEDLALFLKKRMLSKQAACYIAGSGIDTDLYIPSKSNEKKPFFQFLLIARMLEDKGISEYVDAASRILAKNKSVKFDLLGPVDIDNPTAITRAQINKWQNSGIITYLGETEDVRPFITRCDCVVLPSYREGLPRTLIEAASMGKPLIATDVPGCRDIVEDGVNGFLCKSQDSSSLFKACIKMMNLPDETRKKFGEISRQKVISKFSEKIVIDTYIKFIIPILK